MTASLYKRSAKVLFFSETVTLAHMARPAVLAGYLNNTEFEPVIACDPRYSGLFPNLGVRQVELTSISSTDFLDKLAKGEPLYDSRVLKSYVEEDLRLIDQEKPDTVVGDFRLSLAVSARVKRIPYIAISNAYWSPYARVRYTIPEHKLTSLFGVSTAESIFRIARPFVFALHSIPMNKVRRQFGLRVESFSLRHVYTDADYLFYADLEDLVKVENLPSSHSWLGPVLWSHSQARPDWWQELDDSLPTVYVSLGSSGRADLLPIIIEALKDMSVQVLLSTAGKQIPDGLPRNIFASDYLPGDAATEKANLVICNGGSLSTYQAFACGVPVLGIAGNLDQHLNMLAIEGYGAGVRIRTDEVNTGLLVAKLRELLISESHLERARALQDVIQRVDGRKRFIHHLRETLS